MTENEKARLPGDLQRQIDGDIVSIVRCKNCAMWERHTGGTYGRCAGWHTDNVMTSEDFFCGLGSKDRLPGVF